jgi:hypothetical protein
MADDLPPLEKWREIEEINLDMYDDWMQEHCGMVTSRAYWKGRAKAVGKEITCLRAELAEAKAATAVAIEAERERWQPIETAPKDGTSILGGKHGFDPFICHWRDAKGGQWFSDVAHGYWHEGVTHWMPLPEQPAAIRGGDTS